MRAAAGVATMVSSLALAAGEPPPALLAAAGKAKVEGQISAWCEGRLRPDRPQAYAVAVGPRDGRYMVVEGDGRSFDLARFKGQPELACYTPAEARKLSASIARSETIQGKVSPRWTTTVICGFVDETSALCWQYSIARARFVRVGGWTT